MKTYEKIKLIKLEMSTLGGLDMEERHIEADWLLISMIKLLAEELEEDVSEFISYFENFPKWYA
jgi:hypothetical protein